MSPAAEVTLWKAPRPSCLDPQSEVKSGYSPVLYPGDGPYFATEKSIAEDYQRNYLNGIQELHLSRAVYEDLLAHGIIKRDSHPNLTNKSVHVPAAGLAEFNDAIVQGTPNEYWPES